jgi:hypothetical protein
MIDFLVFVLVVSCEIAREEARPTNMTTWDSESTCYRAPGRMVSRTLQLCDALKTPNVRVMEQHHVTWRIVVL